MAKAVKSVRVASNPHSRSGARKSSRSHAAPRKGNHKHMAKKKRKSAASNPHRHSAHNKAVKHYRRRRSNPKGDFGSAKDIAVSAVAGLASAVATSQIPQMVLGTNNTGWTGYGANIVTAAVATFIAGKMAGPRAASAAMVGGAVIVLDRFLTEQVSALGPYISLAGVGDATAARMGTIRTGYFLHPTMTDGNGNMIVPQPVIDAATGAIVAQYPQIAAPPVAAAMNSGKTSSMHAVNPSGLRRHTASGQLLSSRFQGRFNQALN